MTGDCSTTSDMERDATLAFRLPLATRKALQVAADSERRTLSNMALLILEEALTARGFLNSSKATGKRGKRS